MKQLSASIAAKESIRFTIQNYKMLGRLLLVPILLCIGAVFLPNLLSKMRNLLPESFTPALPYVGEVGAFLFEGLILSFWAPKWIQYYADPKRKVRLFECQLAQWQFFFYYFIFSAFLWAIGECDTVFSYLASLIPASQKLLRFLTTMIGGMGWLGLLLGLIILSIRLMFLFPATALSEPTSFKISWKETKSSFWDLLMLAILMGFYGAILLAMGFLTIVVLKFSLNLPLMEVISMVFDPKNVSYAAVSEILKVGGYTLAAVYYVAVTKLYLRSQKT